jgi:aspartyl protease
MVSGRAVRHPLNAVYLSTGFTALNAEVELLVRTMSRQFAAVGFQVDTGTNISTISVAGAEALENRLPAKAVLLQVRTAAGKVLRRVYPGRVSVRVPGLERREFTWPCHFVDHHGKSPTPLLGLAGVLNDLRILFDGTFALEAPHGWVILEELSP